MFECYSNLQAVRKRQVSSTTFPCNGRTTARATPSSWLTCRAATTRCWTSWWIPKAASLPHKVCRSNRRAIMLVRDT